ncbi:hypothetical protein [Marimonas arenosa]|uniref:Sulfotransferase family protein n=1 Tax=Marimonas arenosa TaxID=1795305 RepID=A0AAE3WGU5_9RHOB|nr:hypothetical protein [Marimonas arenosa]MDQ2092273.1 hypothetical protein [Marimonas arenosa]
MRKQMFIHVGAGKTGTSALQAFLFANEARLAEKGVHSPQEGRVLTGDSFAHHGLSNHGPHQQPDPEDVLDLWRQVAAYEGPRVALSSEYFHNRVPGVAGRAFFSAVAQILCDWDIRIVFYLRRQSQWLQSVYAQWVKGHLLSETFSDFAHRYTRNPADQIFDFAEIFGADNVIVRPFERGQFQGGNIQRDFCAAIGIDWDDAFTIPEGNPNPRLAGDALELKRQMNRYAESTRELRALQRDLQAYSDLVSQDSRSVFVSHAMLDADEQRRIEAENEPKYARIARDFLGRADGVLFREPLPDDSKSATSAQASVSTDQVQAYLLMQMHRRIAALLKKGATPDK